MCETILAGINVVGRDPVTHQMGARNHPWQVYDWVHDIIYGIKT